MSVYKVLPNVITLYGEDPTGGYVFVTWVGDHSPYHVHVFKDGRLMLKWDLDNNLAMKGKPTTRILNLINELREEGLL